MRESRGLLAHFSLTPAPLRPSPTGPQGENSPKNSRSQPLNPIVVGRVCPERAASILHPRPGALGTDAPYLEVHGERLRRPTTTFVLLPFPIRWERVG